jgi:hypothetical protein
MAVPPKPVKDMMADCTEATRKEFSFEHQLSRNMGGIFIEVLELIEKGGIHNASQMAVLGLSTRTFRLLQCVGDHIFDGYYEVAMILLRNIYENNLLVHYLVGNEKDAQLWLEGRKNFEQKYLRTKLGHDNKFYKALSTWYAHPERVNVLTSVIKKMTDDKVDLRIYPEFDRDWCQTYLYYYIMLYWESVVELQYAFRDYLWKNEDWVNHFAEWNELVLTYIQERIIKKSNMKFMFKHKLPKR